MDREYIVSADLPFPSYLEQKRQLTQWKKENIWLQKVIGTPTFESRCLR